MISGTQRGITINHDGDIKAGTQRHQNPKGSSRITSVQNADWRRETVRTNAVNHPCISSFCGLVVEVTGDAEWLPLCTHVGNAQTHLPQATAHGNNVLSRVGHAVEGDVLVGLGGQCEPSDSVAL